MKKTPKQLRKEGQALVAEGERKIKFGKAKIAIADKAERHPLKPKIPDEDPEAQALERVRYDMQRSLNSRKSKDDAE